MSEGDTLSQDQTDLSNPDDLARQIPSIGLTEEERLLLERHRERKPSSKPSGPPTFLKLELKPKVTGWNVVAYALGQFIVLLVLSLETTFTTYLLEDNFDIEGKEAAKVAGDLGLYAAVAAVSMNLILGYLMDLFGRKMLLIIGLSVTSIGVACQPLPDQLAWLYVIRIATNLGVVPYLVSPYLVDYIQ